MYQSCPALTSTQTDPWNQSVITATKVQFEDCTFMMRIPLPFVCRSGRLPNLNSSLLFYSATIACLPNLYKASYTNVQLACLLDHSCSSGLDTALSSIWRDFYCLWRSGWKNQSLQDPWYRKGGIFYLCLLFHSCKRILEISNNNLEYSYHQLLTKEPKPFCGLENRAMPRLSTSAPVIDSLLRVESLKQRLFEQLFSFGCLFYHFPVCFTVALLSSCIVAIFCPSCSSGSIGSSVIATNLTTRVV